MIREYIRLADRIDAEIEDLDRSVRRALNAWHHALRAAEDQDIFVDSVALNLHGFYSGLERVFEIVARQVDGRLPEGEAWHQGLLQQMSGDIEGVRPAVIGPDSLRHLDELRRFRHLVRNVYADRIDPVRMQSLLEGISDVWVKLTRELRSLADFLREVSKADDEMV